MTVELIEFFVLFPSCVLKYSYNTLPFRDRFVPRISGLLLPKQLSLADEYLHFN